MLFDVTFESVISKKKNWIKSKCRIDLYKDDQKEPLIQISPLEESENNKSLAFSLDERKLKILAGKETGSFYINSLQLKGTIKFTPLLNVQQASNDVPDLQSEPSSNVPDLQSEPSSNTSANDQENNDPSWLYSIVSKIGRKEFDVDSLELFQDPKLALVKEKLDPPGLKLSEITYPTEKLSTLYGSSKTPIKKFFFEFPNIQEMMENNQRLLNQLQKPTIVSKHNSVYSRPRYNPYTTTPRNVLSSTTSKSSVKKRDSDVRDVDGFSNLGQTCYIAAILQLLFHSRNIRDAVLESRSFCKKVLGEDSVFESFCDLFERKINKEFVTLGKVQSKIAQFTNKFASFDQEDAHEFLMACIDQLSLDGIASPSSINNKNINLPQDQDLNQESLNKQDPIKNTIQFSIVHTLQCKSCHSKSIHSEMFRDLSLFFPPPSSGESDPFRSRNDKIDLHVMLQHFFSPDSVDYTCASCSCTQATLTHLLESLPSTLLFHFNRFEVSPSFGNGGGGGLYKRNDAVHVPSTLHLGDFVHSDCLERDRLEYRLSGIVSHQGISMRRGHYVFSKVDTSTVVDDEKDVLWTQYDDAKVNRGIVGLAPKLASELYVVVYERI